MLQIKNSLWNRGEVHMLLNWLNTLPEELVRSQPELCIAYGGSLLLLGYFDATEKWWQLVEKGLGSMPASDRDAAICLQKILCYRSVNARYHGDFASAIALSQSGLDKTLSTEVRDRGSALLFLGHAHFYAGNTDKAEQVLIDTVHTTQAIGHYSACLNARHYLAQLRVLQGRLHEASEIYEQATLFAGEQGTPIYSGTEYAGLGDLKREWNQLEAAAAEIQRGLSWQKRRLHLYLDGCLSCPCAPGAVAERMGGCLDVHSKSRTACPRSPLLLRLLIFRPGEPD
jgi:LuxR family maltose regulon positive regulatory protein